MIKLAVSGCQGRMGQRITALALNDKQFKIKTLLESPHHPNAHVQVSGVQVSTDNETLKGADVLIEFTLPDATMENLKACVKHKVAMVIGTTGLTPDQVKKIKLASKKIPIVFSSNMSVGVNIFFKLIKTAAEGLPGIKDIKMVEAHHIHKKDAPSGTAKTAAEIAAEHSKQKVSDIKSIREGEIIGFHEITFTTDFDTLKISHDAQNRDMFAKGSLVAAKFLAKKKSGLFNMQDVLGLN